MTKRKALGKGIEALIPHSEGLNHGNVRSCPIEQIRLNPNQPRKSFDQKKMDELVQTIKEKGIISPLLVQREADGYMLISGERRFRAAKKAGLNEIPIVERKADEIESMELSLIENLQREDLNPIDEARAFKELLEKAGYSQETLAKKIGRDRSSISNSLRLLKLPNEIREAIEDGTISAGHGRALISLEKSEDQLSAFRRIVKNKLSVRQAELLVKKIQQGKKEKTVVHDIYLEQIISRLRDLLATKVMIEKKRRGGKIIIEYYSDQDMERILNIISSQRE